MKIHQPQQEQIFRNNIAAVTAYLDYRTKKKKHHKPPGVRTGIKNCKRQRRSVNQIFNEIGRKQFRRAYRMSIESFFQLFKKIKCSLYRAIKFDPSHWYAPNGRIHPSVRLACALRSFAGAEPIDIACTYGISKTEVHHSVTYVIKAINSCSSMRINFPKDHEEQAKIARGFKEISKANLGNCCGAIDGLLIWIEKPTEAQCALMGVGSKKFFCGRKKKFGLNLQATCDSKKRFLNISINFPGSTSDFLAFEASSFRTDLEREGFLKEGLCLYGDNAYVNTSYMATPYPNVPIGDPKDHYNYYQSNVRISIECAFGILVNRWGILRKPLTRLFTVTKINGLINCLASIHNFLIDEREELDMPQQTASDNFTVALHSGFRQTEIPLQILHGGEHFDDDPSHSFRTNILQRNQIGNILPRELILADILEDDLRRPCRRSY